VYFKLGYLIFMETGSIFVLNWMVLFMKKSKIKLIFFERCCIKWVLIRIPL